MTSRRTKTTMSSEDLVRILKALGIRSLEGDDLALGSPNVPPPVNRPDVSPPIASMRKGKLREWSA